MSAVEKLSERRYSVEEYLELEDKSDFRSEYWNGLIVAMAGGTPTHGKIANRVGTTLDNAFDKNRNNCSTYNSDVKVFIPKSNGFVYPDCMVICGEEQLYKNSRVVLTNPCLVIEVLSASTKGYDSGAKFEGYRSIPSFQEYMLVWQTIPKVQTWYKEAEDLWRISSAFGLDRTIRLHSIDCEIALADIYKRVTDLGDQDNPDAF